MSEQQLPQPVPQAEETVPAPAEAAPPAAPVDTAPPVPTSLETAVAALSTQTSADTPPEHHRPGVPAPRTSAQKAAAVLALLDDQTLEQLAGRLPDRHRERLIDNVKALRSVRVDEQQKIAKEFAARIEAERDALRANEETAARLSSTLFVNEDMDMAPELNIADNLADAFSPEDLPIWDRVAQKPIADLIAFFAARPATVFSVALANLPNDISSEIAGELPEDLVKDTMVLVAEGTKMNPLAVEAVEKLLEETLLSLEEDGTTTDPGAHIDTIANMLNRMVSSRREAVMTALKANLDPESLALLDTKVLSIGTLEDRVPRNAIPILFREIDETAILRALKYTQEGNPEIVDYLLRNISQRLATTFKDRMEGMATPAELDGEKAQSALICKILALADEGRIALLDPPPPEG